MPIFARRYRAEAASPSRSTRTPATVTVPESGRSRPAIRLSSVDLPLPDGPRIATASPGRTVSDASCRAGGPSS